jgi:ribosomal protein S18 acetylase RimI-like enzyme
VSLTLRPLTVADAQALADIVGDYDAFHGGVDDRPTAEDMRYWSDRIDESVGAVEESGELVGAGFLRRRGSYYIADFFVRPDARGRGIGSRLCDWGERAAADAGLSSIRAATSARDADGKELLESRGYRYIRSFYRMAIDLDGQPPEPDWPVGFSVALEPDSEKVLYETLEEAFEDHWGHEERTFEQWIAQNGPLGERLCYVVRAADGTVAAAQICDEDRFGTAWVAILGVRAPFRRHGLGEALLRQAFHDLYERGRPRIALGVDAENTTGATRLYQRVGMRVALQDDAYEKLLGQRD